MSAEPAAPVAAGCDRWLARGGEGKALAAAGRRSGCPPQSLGRARSAPCRAPYALLPPAGRSGIIVVTDAGSSNGRTADSGSASLGSSPQSRSRRGRSTRPRAPRAHAARSSSGQGHRPLKAEIAGSNPARATHEPTRLRWARFIFGGRSSTVACFAILDSPNHPARFTFGGQSPTLRPPGQRSTRPGGRRARLARTPFRPVRPIRLNFVAPGCNTWPVTSFNE